MSTSHFARAMVALLGLSLVAGGCQDATAARLTLRTDIEHTQGTRVGVWISSGNAAPEGAPQTLVTAPWDTRGELGDLVVVPPSGATDSTVSVNIALAQDGEPAACLNTPSARCVLARRTLRYKAHTEVRVPIGLYRSCLGVACAPGTTCNYQGRCVSQVLDSGACSEEGGCLIEGDPVQPPGVLVVPARPPEQPDGGEAELQAPAALEFRDENPAPGKVRGRVVLRRAADERRIDGYRLFWTNAQGQPVALAKEWPAQAQDWQWDILPDASLPAGAALLSAVSVYGSRTSAQISVRADNFPRPMPVILDTGADTLVFTKPFLTTEGNDPTLLVLAIDSSNRVTARRCARDGAFCKRTDVSRPGFGPQSAVFGATMLGTSVYVVESTTDRRMVVHKCSVDMTTCSTQDISSGDATVRL